MPGATRAYPRVGPGRLGAAGRSGKSLRSRPLGARVAVRGSPERARSSDGALLDYAEAPRRRGPRSRLCWAGGATRRPWAPRRRVLSGAAQQCTPRAPPRMGVCSGAPRTPHLVLRHAAPGGEEPAPGLHWVRCS